MQRKVSTEQQIDFLYNQAQLTYVPCSYTVAEWSIEWLTSFKSEVLRSSSKEKYQRTIKHIIKNFGHLSASNFNSLQAQKIFNSIKQPSIKDDCYTLLYEMFKKATKLRYCPFNPIDTIEIKKHKKQHGKALTRSQETALVNACQTNYRGLAFLICLYCGLRRGELLAINYEDIDLEKRTIAINKQFQNGKIVPPKTEASIRLVPILDVLLPYIEKLDLTKTGRLFPITETTIREHFQQALKVAGLDGQGITLHSLRHTFATRCAENNTPIHITQKLVGHSTADMTTNVYTHANSDVVKIEIEKLNKGVFSVNN